VVSASNAILDTYWMRKMNANIRLLDWSMSSSVSIMIKGILLVEVTSSHLVIAEFSQQSRTAMSRSITRILWFQNVKNVTKQGSQILAKVVATSLLLTNAE